MANNIDGSQDDFASLFWNLLLKKGTLVVAKGGYSCVLLLHFVIKCLRKMMYGEFILWWKNNESVWSKKSLALSVQNLFMPVLNEVFIILHNWDTIYVTSYLALNRNSLVTLVQSSHTWLFLTEFLYSCKNHLILLSLHVLVS